MPDAQQRVRVPIAPDHPAFAGHFPGQPLLPGVVLLAQAIEALIQAPDCAAWVAAGASLGAVKFLAPVPPGADLDVRWTTDPGRRRAHVEVWRLGPGDGTAGVLAATAQLQAPPEPVA
ncbi:MAG TPA: 3-hydroxyacyl-ACP dehydratase [Ramlibacter sp.]|uniref:3-hydroxyacyl-ACP dehydratase n=1 Tax=Ramlibacter sp. TaxID=1917967 RepID=UPI002D6367FA|nr:3-hydroxyacyl-ACP dehydratase [Ramlibacter sp.]HZY19962.1 3-hydroxyacyl-ACP dehydratase [Ramlibacter sp.]